MLNSKWMKSLFGRNQLVRRNRQSNAEETRGIGGAIARKSEDSYFGTYFAPIVARAGVVTTYAEFSEEVLNQLPAHKVREVIRANPMVAKAIADFADAMASGFTYTADKLMAAAPNESAQRLLDEFVQRQESEAQGFETLIEEIARGMFTHGASFTELIIDEDERTPVRIKSLDPTTAVFRHTEDDLLGDIYELGQDIGIYSVGADRSERRARARVVQRTFSGVGGYNFVSLEDNPTIKYRPIQSDPNYPYGIPILDPAVFHVIMSAGFLSAFRTALTGHVYPNLLITIDKEKFKQFVGASADAKALQAKLNANIEDMKKSLENLKPGGALIQGDEVGVGGSLSGSSGRLSIGSIKDVQDVLRGELTVALQSQPIMMGSGQSVTDTDAARQMLSYARLIQRAQKSLNAVFTGYFNLILELNGYPPLAEFKLNYENSMMYRDQALTFEGFRKGLLTASEDLLKFGEALASAVELGFMSEADAQAEWDAGMELRRQLNILPAEL